MGILYDAEGAGRPPLLGPEEVGVFEFWRAMFARASKIEEPLVPAAWAGAACP